jgi:hypothetical protein
MKGHVKLCILLGGGIFLRSSWLLWGRVKCPPQEFRDFWVLGNFVDPWIHPQASYGQEGSCILKSMSNYIFYQEDDVS